MTLLALLALVLVVSFLSRDPEPAVPLASQKCVVTYDTYVAGQKVLEGGRYCVPWV